jgi:mRNA turnover protein 4
MPKSKRNKLVSLTRAQSKGKAGKEALIESVRHFAALFLRHRPRCCLSHSLNTISQVRECFDEYGSAYVVSLENVRNAKLKDVRTLWSHSR